MSVPRAVPESKFKNLSWFMVLVLAALMVLLMVGTAPEKAYSERSQPAYLIPQNYQLFGSYNRFIRNSSLYVLIGWLMKRTEREEKQSGS
jgi:hypothetical protein